MEVDSNSEHTWSVSSEEVLRKCYPLHRACRDGDVQHLSSLLSSEEYDLYQEDDFYGWTPIHWAAYFGKLSCLLVLQRHNVCIDATTERLNQSPAHIVAYGGHANCLNWLLQHGSQINRQDYMGETPIHKAARTGSMECISLLVSQGANLSMKNYSGHNASQVARQANHPECANYLDRALELQVNTKDQSRGSPEGQPAPENHFISDNTYHSNPHVISYPAAHSAAILNGCNDNNNQSEDCSMEMDDGIAASSLMTSSRDVLLDHGVTSNLVPVAGKKRGREEIQEDCNKRARNDDIVFMNGTTEESHHHDNTVPGEIDMESCENLLPVLNRPSPVDNGCQDKNGIRVNQGYMDENKLSANPSISTSSCLRYRELPVKCIGLMSHYI